MARIHPVSFFVARKGKDRTLRLHQRRDLGAAIEILARLLDRGFAYGEPLLNMPPPCPPPQPVRELWPVDLSFVEPGDLLLQTTRPPLDDRHESSRKQVERGWTDLEARLFQAWRPWFQTCSRQCVRLADELWTELPRGFENRRSASFRQNAVGAPYSRLPRRPPDARDHENRTAAYLLWVEEAWQGGPGLLGAFGMDGIANQVWAYRLGRDLAYLLEEPCFAMAELSVPDVPERASDLLSAWDWKVDVLIRVPSRPGPGAAL